MLPAALFHVKFLPVRSGVHSPQGVGKQEWSLWRLLPDFLVCQESHRKCFKLQMGCVFSDLKVQLCIEDDLEAKHLSYVFLNFEHSGSDLVSPNTLLRILNSTSCRPSVTKRDKEGDSCLLIHASYNSSPSLNQG